MKMILISTLIYCTYARRHKCNDKIVNIRLMTYEGALNSALSPRVFHLSTVKEGKRCPLRHQFAQGRSTLTISRRE
jgi:hypothetical protein